MEGSFRVSERTQDLNKVPESETLREATGGCRVLYSCFSTPWEVPGLPRPSGHQRLFYRGPAGSAWDACVSVIVSLREPI